MAPHQLDQHPVITTTRRKRFAADVLSPLPDEQKGVYGLGLMLQLSASEAGILTNIRSWGSDTVDLELGNDLLVIDRPDAQAPRDVIPLNRTSMASLPSNATNYLLSKYPMTGGFVPLGALRADGTAHPHAGTGFGLCNVKGFPLDPSGQLSIRYLGQLDGLKAYNRMEFQQYRFDGKQFLIEHSDVVEPDKLLNGWRVTCPPLGNCEPDGDDLLNGVICRPSGQSAANDERADTEYGTPHLARWRRLNDRWTLISVQPVADEPEFKFIEPSLVRDLNGDLLLSARDFLSARDYGSHTPPLVTVWRSSDNGGTWQQSVRRSAVRAQAPVSVNLALNGCVYLASCPPKGNNCHINLREKLCLWPLSRDREDILAPSTARDCIAEFGVPTHRLWRVDHPVGMNVRLSDGAWHHLLCYRIMEEHGAPPTHTTGLYVEEVMSEKCVEPPWRFAEQPAGAVTQESAQSAAP